MDCFGHCSYSNMDITQFDVKTIFPNGDLLEEIFVDQLGGFKDMFNSFKACQLKKQFMDYVTNI
jgi:hypothetical protein